MASTGFGTEGGGLLKILYLGIRNSIEMLDDDAFTQSNRVGNAQLEKNTTLDDVEKLGVLAGSVAASKGEGVVGAGEDSNDKVVGLFVNDAAGNAFESTSAAASGKGVYVHGMGTYEVGIFETRNAADDDDLKYVAGDLLYCSQNGLLTKETGGHADAVVIGVCMKAPTSEDPTMRVNLRV